MYKEIEAYLGTFYERLKSGQYTSLENEEIIYVLEKLLEIGLVDEKEYELWKSRIGGIYTKPIECLNLSVRAKNCLLHSNINTWGKLRDRLLCSNKQNTILKIRNLGKVTAYEIVKEAIRCHVITEDELSVCVDKDIMRDLNHEFGGKECPFEETSYKGECVVKLGGRRND